MNSVVLWYDIGRQGATNESMALSPILKDLSGNGNDATCYNFGWTEKSGINSTNYPNALVSDGVDDYAVVTGLPLLTPETGYTIIARRARISEVAGSAFAGLPTAANTPAIQIEREYGNSIYVAFNFGQPATITPDWSDVVIWQTSAAYCGVSLLKANAFPSDSLYLFKGSKALPRGAFSLYSLILFNRDLTDEEIEWVKSNLIQ